jgi:hypothetical protein
MRLQKQRIYSFVEQFLLTKRKSEEKNEDRSKADCGSYERSYLEDAIDSPR